MDKPHKKLDAWKTAMDLVIEVYKETENFPKEERYGLTRQIRDAVVSIPSNIAEGAGRNTNKEFINFLHISQASLSELDTQLDIATRLRFLTQDDRERLDKMMLRIDKIVNWLNSLSGVINS